MKLIGTRVSKVVPSLEHGVAPDVDKDVQVTSRRAERPGLALAAKADTGAGIDARRNGNVQLLGLIHPPFPAALAAGLFDHLAATVAGRAGPLDHEEALLGAYLAVAAAQVATARTRAGLGARAIARLASCCDFDLDLGLLAVERLFQADFQVIAQVSAAPGLLTPAAAKGAAENRLEDVAQVGKSAAWPAGTATHSAVLESGMAIAVIGCTLLRVLEAFIGLADRLEPGFGLGIARVAIRVIAHGQLAVRGLDRGIISAALHLEQLVIVDFY